MTTTKKKKTTKKTTTAKRKTTKKSAKKTAKKTTKATKMKSPAKKAKAASKTQTEAVQKTSAKAAVKKAKKRGRKRSGECEEPDCSKPILAEGFCRECYIRHWYAIIEERKMKARENLNKYIETIAEKYPDNFMSKIRNDLETDGAFRKRLEEFGFREEYESSDDENPFNKDSLKDLMHALKFED